MGEVAKTRLVVIAALVVSVTSAGRGRLADSRGVLLADQPVADAGRCGLSQAERCGPKVRVDNEQHDFGKLDVDVAGRHGFVFANVGSEPLMLSRDRATCGCCTCVCAVRLPDGPVGPGESAHVTLEWKSTLYVGPFRQTATIVTNDPDRRHVTLAVSGRFTGPVGIVPSQVALSSMRQGQAASCEVRLYSYLPELWKITGCELPDATMAKCFDVAWEPLPAEQVKEEGEAQSGHLVRINVRPGLPVGAFRQTIRLKTDSTSVPWLEIPVQGVVVGDISVAGRGWNAQTGVLSMGTIKRSEGTQWPLLIVVRGPQAGNVRLEAGGSVPPWLKVELQPVPSAADAELSLTRLKIRIPPGSGPSMHLGEGRGEPGRITIRPDPPLLPDLSIEVRFAVSE